MTEVVHQRTCTLCEAMCGIKIKTDGEKVISIKGDTSDPFSRGYICPKASALAELHHDPDRLQKPLVKKNGAFVEASWDEALDKAADIIHTTQKKYGRHALATYAGNPNVHNFGALFYIPQFLRNLRTHSKFSATSLDQLPHMFSAYHMFGHQLLMSIPDIDHTDYMVIIGGNPLASHGSIMSAPDIRNRLKDIEKRGGKLVVLDPRRTETADIATEHHFIRPGTDAALLMAITYTICHELGPKLGHLKHRIKDADKVDAIAKDWTPERAAEVTGVPADVIRDIAKELHSRDKAICYGRMGTSTQEFGGVNHWLINVINILTNNMDTRGGMMFTQPAVDLVDAPEALGADPGNWDRWQSRVRGLSEFGGELPSSVLAEEMLTEGDGQLKAFLTIAGNPVISAPNGTQLEKALGGLEGYIAIDCFVNETTCHADVILPPVSALERSHFDLIFHALAIRNTAKYSDPVFEKPKGAKEDWEIMQAISHRLAILRGKTKIKDKALRQVERQFTPERFLATYLVTLSPYRPIKGTLEGSLSMQKLKDHPEGIDLGPLNPCLLDRLKTKDQCIHLAPQLILDDCQRMDTLQPIKEGEFQLIGRRHIRSCNSWLHNAPKLKKGKQLCTLLLHPSDAEKLTVEAAQMVKVTSRVGEVEVPVEISDEIMPGVVSIPHGYGHHRDNTQLTTAQKKPGVSVNDLTDDLKIDPLTGNAAFNGVAVTLSV